MAETQTNRYRGKEEDRQVDKQTNTQSDGLTKRETERHVTYTDGESNSTFHGVCRAQDGLALVDSLCW
jgi:hypothetical protein